MYFETETKIEEDEKTNRREKLYQRMASKLNTAHYCYYYTPIVCFITFWEKSVCYSSPID